MKKVFVVACLSVFVLASCKKDYTCECTILGTKTTSTIKDAKKKDAEDACKALGVSSALLGGSCAIK